MHLAFDLALHPAGVCFLFLRRRLIVHWSTPMWHGAIWRFKVLEQDDECSDIGLRNRNEVLVRSTPRPDLPVLKEARLIADVLQGDRKAIAEFVRAYSDAVYAFLYRRLDERTVVEDLCQEVFLIAWSELAKFEGRSSLKTWMCAIAQHKVADFYRRQIRELPLRDDESEGERTLDLTGQPLINLDQAFDRKLSEERIRSTLLRMPEGHRAILRWRYWDGQSLQDIANETGRTVKAIERLLARSRADFAARWKEDEHAGPV